MCIVVLFVFLSIFGCCNVYLISIAVTFCVVDLLLFLYTWYIFVVFFVGFIGGGGESAVVRIEETVY